MRHLPLLCLGLCCAVEPWEADLRLPADIAALRSAPVYRLEATLTDDRLDGVLRLDWRNDTTEALPDLAFQGYANGDAFHGSRMEVTGASVDGAAITGTLFAEDQGIRLPLARPLAPGAVAAVEVRWRLALSAQGGNHGLLALRKDGGAILHAWYPEAATRRDGAWQVEMVPEMGDPARARAHHALATLHLHDGLELIAGGTITAERDDDGPMRTVTVAGAGVRNLTLVVGRARAVAERQVAGTRVRSWWRPGHEDGGRRALEIAARSVEIFGAAFGPYPWPELEVIDADLGGPVGGVESCGLILIAGQSYDMVIGTGADWPVANHLGLLMLHQVVAHEVCHQWWQGMVGNDAVREPWLDESLTSWSTAWWTERALGADAGRAAWQVTFMEAFGARPRGFPSLEQGINGFSGTQEIGREVYGRGALAWQALRRQVGDERLLAALKAWGEIGRFRAVDAPDLRALLERTLGAEAVATWWTRWIQGQGLEAQDLAKAIAPAKP